MASVSFRRVSKSFGATRVLRAVDLEVADGEFIALLGPSGCGKTTLLRILAGLEAQDDGEVAIGGRVIDDAPPKARDIAMVFQSYALYPYMSVRQNIALPLVMRRLNALQRAPLVGRLMGGTSAICKAIDAEVGAVAEALQIRHLLDRKPGQLSGGQRQRVALARAMVRKPAAFLMDEPLSNLDAKLRVQARAEIADLHRRLGATFVYVTHDQAEAMTMADRVAVMMEGELLQVAPPQAIYADPADIRVAEFIGAPAINIVPGTVTRGGRIVTGEELLPLAAALPEGTAVRVGIRPEHLAPTDDGGTPTVVRHIENLGADVFVHAEAAGMARRLVARLTPDASRRIALGTPLRLGVAGEHALVFTEDGKRAPVMPASSAPALQLAG